MDNLPKIECQTVEIIKSKKTGKTYNNMEDFLKENTIEDLQKDLKDELEAFSWFIFSGPKD